MTNPDSDARSQLPVNHSSSFSLSSNNNSLSSLTNRNNNNRYYALASPSSSFYIASNEHSTLPHNRQNNFQTPKWDRQIRNNMHYNSRAVSFLQNYQQFNSDEEDPCSTFDLLEPNDMSLLSNEIDNESAIGVSYEIFPGQSFRAARRGEGGFIDQPLFIKPNQSKVKPVKDTKVHSQPQEHECSTSQILSIDDLPYNWQASKSTIKERISCMFNKDTMADVYFSVGQSPNIKRFPGHQFVLAISSAVFDAMFFGPLSAKKVKKSVVPMSDVDHPKSEKVANHVMELTLQHVQPAVEIQVPDVDPVAFLALLKFIYTDEVHICHETVMTILYAAKKYSVPALEKFCVDYLRQNLSSDNAFMLLSQARLFNEAQFAHQCLDVIDKNTTETLSAEGFLDIDLDTLCAVLDRDTLGIREVKLFQAMVSWARSQQKKDDRSSPTKQPEEVPNSSCAQTSVEHLKTVLGPALQLIRFPLMSIEDFAAIVVPTRILSDREMVDMFLYYLINPKPSILYKDTPRCCLTGKEQVVNRYPVVEQRWGYSGTSDRIRFMVDRKIFIVGFGLYGSAQGPSEYQVIIEILLQDSGAILASNYLSFKCDGSNNTFRVRFKEPVEILANVSYIACATLKGPDSYYGSIGYQKVIHESATHGKVSFQFNYSAGNNNGTSVEDGQIPEIVFYM